MIWLIGCKGMLGSEVAKQLDEAKLPWVGTDIEVDITNPEALEKFAKTIETEAYFPSALSHSERQIKWVINCSAYTNVDKAEEEQELAQKLNEEGARNIARLTREIGAKLIHISTDYVFDGKGSIPYSEDMPKAPLGVYGKTKLAGEIAIQKEMNTYYIIRTAWLYGFKGKNFVYSMTKAMNSRESVKVVNDQYGTPTCTVDLANVIIQFIEKNDNAKAFFGKKSAPAYGIYHFTNAGQTSWHDFATEIYRLGKKYGRIKNDCIIEACSTEDLKDAYPAPRPAMSILNKDKITKALKLKIPLWKASLEKFLKNPEFNSAF